MPLNSEQVKYLKENIDKSCVHGKNILSKKNKEEIENFYPKYIEFYETMQSEDINDRIISFINYKDYVTKTNKTTDNRLIFSSQAKSLLTLFQSVKYGF